MGRCDADDRRLWGRHSDHAAWTFFGAIVAVLGIGLFALPASILASGFIEAAGVDEETAELEYCPCCGEDLEQFR